MIRWLGMNRFRIIAFQVFVENRIILLRPSWNGGDVDGWAVGIVGLMGMVGHLGRWDSWDGEVVRTVGQFEWWGQLWWLAIGNGWAGGTFGPVGQLVGWGRWDGGTVGMVALLGPVRQMRRYRLFLVHVWVQVFVWTWGRRFDHTVVNG